MRIENDWRLTNQINYLKEVDLAWRHYRPSNSGNDHDHCEFCTAKFMEGGGAGAITDGYSTLDGCRWICKECFADFIDIFGWRVEI